MGLGRPQFRHLDHLVSRRRRFLHRLYGDRGSGAGLCGWRLWLLCAALYDHRLSLCLHGHAAPVETGQGQWLRDCRRCGVRAIRLARAGTGGGAHRRHRNHALYRAAAGRHGCRAAGSGLDGRAAAGGRLRHPGALHLFGGPARARADRLRQGHHDLYRCHRRGGADPVETRRLCQCIRLGGCRLQGQ